MTYSAYVAAEPIAQKILDEKQPPFEICVILTHSELK